MGIGLRLRSGNKKTFSEIPIITFLLVVMIMAAIPLSVYAVSPLVPCGQTDQTGKVDQCTLDDLILLVVRLINYLITVAAIVAMYYVLLSGFFLITSLGNPEKIKNAKAGISNAVVGFAMVILAFVFVNLLVNGIFGDPGAPRKWWDPQCIYDITDTHTQGCPVGTN